MSINACVWVGIMVFKRSFEQFAGSLLEVLGEAGVVVEMELAERGGFDADGEAIVLETLGCDGEAAVAELLDVVALPVVGEADFEPAFVVGEFLLAEDEGAAIAPLPKGIGLGGIIKVILEAITFTKSVIKDEYRFNLSCDRTLSLSKLLHSPAIAGKSWRRRWRRLIGWCSIRAASWDRDRSKPRSRFSLSNGC